MVLSYLKNVSRLCLKPDDKMMNPERNCERCEDQQYLLTDAQLLSYAFVQEAAW